MEQTCQAVRLAARTLVSRVRTFSPMSPWCLNEVAGVMSYILCISGDGGGLHLLKTYGPRPDRSRDATGPGWRHGKSDLATTGLEQYGALCLS